MNRQFLVLAAAIALALPACQADQSGVSGTVIDQPFDSLSGFAERLGSMYILTLSDDPGFTCTSNPVGDYLTVEMTDVDGSGSYAASGNVTFNEVSDIISQEPASSGTFSINVVTDALGEERIEGTIDASGATSNVSGSFEVPVCD